jgi:adenylosuccinate lyase
MGSEVATAPEGTKREKNLALPGNLRYQPKVLKDIFGYDNLFATLAEVEVATMEVLGEIGVIPVEDAQLLTPEVIKQLCEITTSEVDEIERTITKHDVRAWVRRAQEILPPPLRRWVHVPLTSYDPLDTGRALQFARAHEFKIKPLITEVIREFAQLTRKFSGTLQIGRTHGQHALPITVGFWLATILHRILCNAKEVDFRAGQLVGKISGAVGAYNAQTGLGFQKQCGKGRTFEERVLAKLYLKPAPISTQIAPPEYLTYFLFANAMLSAAFGQFGRDGRNLMRSEIGEIAEGFEEGQVGSSTMAQKRNPINFENLEGMWKRNKSELGKVLDNLVSDHQRDLVGSSIARDFPIIIVNLAQQLNTLLRKDKHERTFLSRISVDEQSCRRNFEQSAHLILAEPVYIALQMAGYEGDAHELVNRQAVPVATNEKIQLIAVIESLSSVNQGIRGALDRMPKDLLGLLHTPEKYTGEAQAKALQIADTAELYCNC